MYQLPGSSLSAQTLDKLAKRQALVDNSGAYPNQVAKADNLWDTSLAMFVEIKQKLDQMCSGNRRCHYCEDSAADEVEHIWPKSLYPNRVFDWTNYLYACGPCNGAKNNHFAVFRVPDRQVVVVARAKGEVAKDPPIEGDSVFINPRGEDPMSIMILDLLDTFQFVAVDASSSEKVQRFETTCGRMDLNGERSREYLVNGRRTAYHHYLTSLKHAAANRTDATELNRLGETVKCSPHRTVWLEMIRQRDHHPVLKELFQQVPEALAW